MEREAGKDIPVTTSTFGVCIEVGVVSDFSGSQLGKTHFFKQVSCPLSLLFLVEKYKTSLKQRDRESKLWR